MKLTSKQLRRIIKEELENQQSALEQVKAAEAKAIEAYKLLPKDFAPGVLLKSAVMGIINARKQLENKPQ
jgi:hypothetical protein